MGVGQFKVLLQTITCIVILTVYEKQVVVHSLSVPNSSNLQTNDARHVRDKSEFAERLNNNDDSRSREVGEISQNNEAINITSFHYDVSNTRDNGLMNKDVLLGLSRNLKMDAEDGNFEYEKVLESRTGTPQRPTAEDTGSWSVIVTRNGLTTIVLCKDVNETKLTMSGDVSYRIKPPEDYNVTFPKCCPPGHRYKSVKDENGESYNVCAPDENKQELILDISLVCGPVELTYSKFKPESISYGDPCKDGKYKMSHEEDDFYIAIDGKLYLDIEDKKIWTPFESKDFCLETFEELDENGTKKEIVLPLMCFDSIEVGPSKLKLIIYATALLISVPFLIATLLAYTLVEPLRDVHGKALSCHVVCLAVAFFSLACIQLSDGNLDMGLCAAVAFLIQFSFMACFFWLNVMCIETYITIRDAHEEISKRREWWRFIYYSIYAWGGPILILVITLVLHYSPLVPASYAKPGLGRSACWFETKSESMYYFYLPMGALILANIIIFIKTTRRLSAATSFEHPCRPRSRYYKTLFRQCLILFLVMGINWVMEIVSWAVGGPFEIWVLFDVINALQGVIIFGIFVCHEHHRTLIWKELRKKCSCWGSNPTEQEMMALGNNTATGPLILNGNMVPHGEDNLNNGKLSYEQVNFNGNGTEHR